MNVANGTVRVRSAYCTLAVVIVLVLLASLAACGGQAADESLAEPAATKTSTEEEVIAHRFSPCEPTTSIEPWQKGIYVAFSLDSKWVFFTRWERVYVAAADGSSVRRSVDAVPQGQGAPERWDVRDPMSAISVSPDGSRLLFSTCEFESPARVANGWQPNMGQFQYDIAMVDAAGGEPVRVTASDAYDNFPAWSPDGTRIAFLSARHRSLSGSFSHLAHLYTMAPDGSNVRPLSRGVQGVINHPPQWSPDGQQLAFVGRDDERKHWLYTVGTDTGVPRQLTAATRAPVSWSPDGQRLAFAQAEDDTIALVTIAADGSDAQRVTTIDGWQPQYGDPNPAEAWITTLAWSPTGDHILFSCSQGICISTLDGMSADTSTLPVEGSAAAAAWSPDGTRIAVLSYGTGVPSPVLYLMAPDATDVQILVQAGHDRALFATRAPRREATASSAERDDLARRAACSAGVVVRDPAQHPDLVRDCETLVELRPQLMGALTLNWDAQTPIEKWIGVSVAGAPPRVTALQLSGLGLVGQLPVDLGALTHLQVLNLSRNGIYGPLPTAIGRLTHLGELNLAQNALTGNLPAELGQLGNLRRLNLWSNALTGPIPAEITQLSSLEELDLSNNELSGPIPVGLGRIESLDFVSLAGNKFWGCIPSALAHKQLERSDLYRLDLPACEAST